MTHLKNIFSTKIFLLPVVAIFILSSCGEQDLVSVSEGVAVSAAKASGPNAQSLTISGSNTTFVSAVDCSTCTYVVSANTGVIDGEKLGLKPGSVICLDAVIKYGNISFINLEGTSESPIIIGNCNRAGG